MTVPDRSSQPQAQPTPASLTPQPNRILATPDTAAACKAEYDSDFADDVRTRMDNRDAKDRH
jgi:hypothetical protein